MLIDKYQLSKKEKIIEVVKKMLNHNADWVSFEGNYRNFQDVLAKWGGYDADAIFEKVSSSAIKVKKGEACFERDGYLFFEEEFDLELLSVFYEIAMMDNRISCVDYGGSLASTFFQNRRKLQKLNVPLRWNIIEQDQFVSWGQANIEDKQLKFYRKIDEVGEYNIVLFSAALQYIENYKEILNIIFDYGPKYIITDRVTISNEKRICVEHVHEPIYEASYPVIVFDEIGFREMFEKRGYFLESEWIKNRNWAYNAEGKLVYEKSYFWVKK